MVDSLVFKGSTVDLDGFPLPPQPLYKPLQSSCIYRQIFVIYTSVDLSYPLPKTYSGPLLMYSPTPTSYFNKTVDT